MQRAKSFWRWVLLTNWGIIFLFWFFGSRALFASGLGGVLLALGSIAGLSAAYMILQQFFFMGRLPYLERVFGLDTLSRLHHTNGQRGFLLLVLHPILVVIGSGMLTGNGLGAQFVALLGNRNIVFAFIAALLFSAVVGLSIWTVQSRLRYETWYFVHLLAYAAVFFSFWHQFELGVTITGSKIFYTYWIALYVAVFASHIAFRFVRPIFLAMRHRFHVSRVVRESPSAVSVYISGEQMNTFSIQPGQFMILRFFTKKTWWQAHPFSLSMVPNGKEIRITVKELGDFTRVVKEVPVGTKVMIDGPYGIFTNIFSVSQKILFIAGGIGITPVRSLMEEMLAKGKDVVLLYANKTVHDAVFKDEFEELAKKYSTRITHIISNDSSYNGERGLIDEEKIKRLVPDASSREVFLCGPPPMMDAVIDLLKNSGVSQSKIHFERFSL